MIANSSSLLDQTLWHPNAFLRDFGKIKHPLINCLTGNVVPNAPLSTFWEGFQAVGKRLKDSKGTPMLLKLKVK